MLAVVFKSVFKRAIIIMDVIVMDRSMKNDISY